MRSPNLTRLGGLALVATLTSCGAPSAASDRLRIEALLPDGGALLADEDSGAASPFPDGPMTVETAQRIALARNPGARAALAALGIARGQWEAANAFPNPELHGGYPAGIDGSTLHASLSIPLAPLVERAERRAIARSEHRAALAQTAGQLLDLLLQVRLAALAVIADDADQAQVAERQAIAEAEREAAEVIFEAGNITEYSRLMHRWNAERGKVELVEAQLTRLHRRNRLELLMGVPLDRYAWSLVAPEEPAVESREPPVALEQAVLAASVELAERRAGLEAAAHRIGLGETARWLPGLTLSVEAESHDGKTEWGPQLGVELPLFDQKSGHLQSERAAFDAALEDYRARQNEVRAALRESWAELRAADEILQHYNATLLPLQQQLMEQDVLRYNAMDEGVFGLLEQRRRLADEQRQALRAQHRRWQAQARLSHLLDGGRLTPAESIASPMAPASSVQPSAH